jgi:hypothetical protein
LIRSPQAFRGIEVSVVETMDRKGHTQMKHSITLFAAAVALTLAASTPSQADLVQLSYQWSDPPSTISAGNSGVVLTSNGGVKTNLDANTVAANVTWFSSASSTSPDMLPAVSEGGYNYRVTVNLAGSIYRDPFGDISFTGLLQGSLTHDSVNLTNVITGLSDGTGTHAGQTSAVFTFDNTQYTLSYNGFTAPTLANAGAISFHIAADPQVVGGPTAPEPSGMVLGCLGLRFLGGVVYRARRRMADLLNAAV